jgi:hypothetical protein
MPDVTCQDEAWKVLHSANSVMCTAYNKEADIVKKVNAWLVTSNEPLPRRLQDEYEAAVLKRKSAVEKFKQTLTSLRSQGYDFPI